MSSTSTDTNARHYAGDLELEEAWALLRDESAAVLVDVRTQAEWQFVGVPVLDELGKQPRFVEWSTYPHGIFNNAFVEQAAENLDRDTPVLFLCRSGVRSRDAAQEFSAAGFTNAYNISVGFEGPLDELGHRTDGWRHSGLPWRQG